MTPQKFQMPNFLGNMKSGHKSGQRYGPGWAYVHYWWSITDHTDHGSHHVKDNAFSGCASLTRVDLPAKLRKIGCFAFHSCSNLCITEIPSGTNTILHCSRRTFPVSRLLEEWAFWWNDPSSFAIQNVGWRWHTTMTHPYSMTSSRSSKARLRPSVETLCLRRILATWPHFIS
jgi:hypothetical protein